MRSLLLKGQEDDFDPEAPLVGTDGLLYENFIARLQDRPVNDWRCRYFEVCRILGYSEERAIVNLIAIGNAPDRVEYWSKSFSSPAIGSPAGIGSPRTCQATPHSVYPANHAKVRRRMGA